jgi:hypothetical protein
MMNKNSWRKTSYSYFEVLGEDCVFAGNDAIVGDNHYFGVYLDEPVFGDIVDDHDGNDDKVSDEGEV